MKKSQVSFEFIMLFAIVFFVFAVFVSLFPSWLDRTTPTKKLAENLANDIKIKVITASLASSDFEADIEIPEKINDVSIYIVISAQDDLFLIKDVEDDKILARAFLPKIDAVDGDPNGVLQNVPFFKISKISNVLTIDP